MLPSALLAFAFARSPRLQILLEMWTVTWLVIHVVAIVLKKLAVKPMTRTKIYSITVFSTL